MEKEQYRSVIRFLFLDGKTCEEIKTKLDAFYGNPSPSMTTVRYWFNEFKRDRSSIFDEERLGCPADVVTEEIVEKVHDMILADRRTKVREAAEAIGVSYGTAFNILHDNLGMAPAHSSAVATAKLVELRYDLLPHPPYSSDLASCDFFLFPNLKKWFGGKRFTSNEEVIAESPLFLVIADLVMRKLERTLSLIRFPLLFYYRYVDDIIMAAPDSSVISILDIFNSQHPRLQFIMEILNISNRLKNIIMVSNRKSVVNDNSVDVVQPSWFTVPFVRGISEKFGRLNSGQMRVSFYSINKLREFIRVHKDPLPRDKKSNVVYKIFCKSCDASYVGQTCRQLKSRIMEHRNHIRWNTSIRNVITEHRLQEGYDFDWDNVIILDEEPHYRKRLISEMIFVRRQTHGLNLQMDMEGLLKAYLPIIDKL
ncbi:Histone-lysine N-methyltransferase SETMAR [Trachymyrmex zeteki]|uniref:Histone-lysine N-methyltransferase SETMAR n=1 Tax=Mycetomoellerius zeteki TaxID=64791 RepID=A0A151WE57_9HYME|nr:Histone-lysine N-methyltransferase SETMAR [Trachymyrmex zeteki]